MKTIGHLPKSMLADILECTYDMEGVMDFTVLPVCQPLAETLSVAGSRPGATEWKGEDLPRTASEHDVRAYEEFHHLKVMELEHLRDKVSRKRIREEGDYIKPLMWSAEERRNLKLLEKGLDPVGDQLMKKALRRAGIPVPKKHGPISVGITAMVEQAQYMNAVKGRP